MATSLKHGLRRSTGARTTATRTTATRTTATRTTATQGPRAQPDLLAEVDRRPGIPLRRGRDLAWLTRWMPDLDDPIRVAHEKTWGLMAVAGAVVAGGITMVSFEQPEFDVWLAALLGAFAGILALPLLAILVRLSVFLAAGGAVAAAAWYFA